MTSMGTIRRSSFFNTSGGSFINVQMVLHGYQPGTLNYGITQTVPLANMGGTADLNWAPSPAHRQEPPQAT